MYSDDATMDTGLGGTLALSSEDKLNLRSAGKWGRILGIVGMVILGLFLVAILFGGGSFLTLLLGAGLEDDGFSAGMGAFGAVTMVFYGAFILFGLYLYYLLYNFGDKAVRAVDTNNTAAMSEAFASQSRLYKILGIATMIYVALMALGLLTMVVGIGAAAASS